MKPPHACEKKGGRKKASVAQPELIVAVKDAVAEHTAGSPVQQDVLWTNRSPREIANELAERGWSVCPDTVRRILRKDLRLGVRQILKQEATCQCPCRQEQFEHIAEARQWHLGRHWPVISVDTKKKELLGPYFRSGTAYTNTQLTAPDHDFAGKNTPRLTPYGVYDVARNEGLVTLSLGADTSELVCESVWRWWQLLGRRHYWHASGLLVLCDCGGGNGYRVWRFKQDLKDLAIRLRRTIEVAHYPPGCSKYNPIEHRMFCHVSRALRSVKLTSLEVARRFIERTHTRTGLRVVVDTIHELFQRGRKATHPFLEKKPVIFDAHLPKLNYVVTPSRY